MRKRDMESWEQLVAAELAEWDAMEAELAAEGSLLLDFINLETYEELDVLHAGARWELDPASAEDYEERMRG